jgi:predicted nucleic acid-binding protein
VKALIDTNVILDALAARKPFRKAAEQIFLMVAEETIEGLVTASGVTDIYYIIRKSLTAEEAHKKMEYLFSIFSIIDVSGKDCKTALNSPITDFEDALMMICGIKAGADCIISRDDDFQKAAGKITKGNSSGVPVIQPGAFIEQGRSRRG